MSLSCAAGEAWSVVSAGSGRPGSLDVAARRLCVRAHKETTVCDNGVRSVPQRSGWKAGCERSYSGGQDGTRQQLDKWIR